MKSSITMKLKISLLAFLFLPILSMAQKKDAFELNKLKGLFEAHKHEKIRYEKKSIKPKNEFEFLISTGFNTYKSFFSSQDSPSCVFYPSCSVYSVLAFQQKGLVVGTLMTFDRLSRCHRMVTPGQYVFDPKKERFHDPIH